MKLAYRVSNTDEIVDVDDSGRGHRDWRGDCSSQGWLNGLVLWWAWHLCFFFITFMLVREWSVMWIVVIVGDGGREAGDLAGEVLETREMKGE